MKAFLTLVRNDSKLEKEDRRHRSLLSKVYAVFAVVLINAALTFSKGYIDIHLIIWCLLILTPFGSAILVVNKEWQEGTTGWWLALPYSRSLLLSAKWVASFWRVLKMYGIFFASILILASIYNLTLPVFLPKMQLLDLLQACARDLSWLIIISPFSIILGALMVIITRSHWIPVSLIFWVMFGLMANLYVAEALGLSPQKGSFVSHSGQGFCLIINGSDFFTTFLISLAVSSLLFVFSVYLLKKHVEL
ncbi:hypothetical protein [Desulfosporosinus nitroreducens]|uniref:ABC transporter permease n=1 Tax=Desulfosporosinus nitroreducens TaxID=2018668 RepID=A0ABT8QT36_9FIRM|nr:hypothetical protein [Desulfosporosinus nitroreducens]MDO0823800.1 hypothetical protein [Desulfosporosinus nitroreducens]